MGRLSSWGKAQAYQHPPEQGSPSSFPVCGPRPGSPRPHPPVRLHSCSTRSSLREVLRPAPLSSSWGSSPSLGSCHPARPSMWEGPSFCCQVGRPPSLVNRSQSPLMFLFFSRSANSVSSRQELQVFRPKWESGFRSSHSAVNPESSSGRMSARRSVTCRGWRRSEEEKAKFWACTATRGAQRPRGAPRSPPPPDPKAPRCGYEGPASRGR